ncbi:RNA polymerase factor sigma-54 [Bacillus pinisoli]|uniref:RNA polymerase factor sigma-54 n=1 Tax=Bacillus pinisoli TaxID=2901866 RepID=UPI001FF6B9C5|nr:RNA polymerase factor sigma-54 [Bacillus pinisoli]
MKTGLVQQQTTKLSLTKELRQAITLLQYTSFELTTYLNDLSLENPFIDLHEPTYSPTQHHRKKVRSSDQQIDYDIAAPDAPTLEEYIQSQLILHPIPIGFQQTILFLIQNFDEQGYLRYPIEELCFSSSYSTEELVQALYYIQSELEPVGIGAGSLQESLLIQLRRKYPKAIVAQKIVEQYFTQLAERKWDLISKALKVSTADIKTALELIQTLNPRPASEYKKAEISYIVPDLFLEKHHGQYKIFMNERSYASFSINKDYLSLKNERIDQDSANYLKLKYQEASWVKQSVEQRKRTMVKVTEAIVTRQRQFFDKGVSYLQPLTLRDIAEEVDMHESTISRTVRGKFLQTPSGVYELKYFFQSKVRSTNEQEISSVRVKELLSDIIKKENKQQPLSDQKISEMLKRDHQLKVSRRTVAKYREQLNIPSSSSRKHM